MDAYANLSYGKISVAPSPAASGTSLTIAASTLAAFPLPPFNATVWPDMVMPTIGNAEIVRVTALAGGGVATIIRAQEGTTARTILVNDQLAAGITKKVMDNIAWKDTANTFTASQTISADFASVFLSHAASAVDQRLFRVMSRGTHFEIEAAADNLATQKTALQIARDGTVTIPIALNVPNALVFSLFTDVSYNDAVSHSIGGSNAAGQRMGMLVVSTAQGAAYMPFFGFGGAGVWYKWTILDPDTGWIVNWYGTFNYVEQGSGANTYAISFDGASGTVYVQRTAGAAAYRVRLYLAAFSPV